MEANSTQDSENERKINTNYAQQKLNTSVAIKEAVKIWPEDEEIMD